MPENTALEVTALIVLALSALAAGWSDVRYRRISNRLCVATALAGFAYALTASGLAATGSHALHLLIALVAGMVLFRMGGIGGGDAKYYAAVAAWFALDKAVLLLLAVTMSGLVLLIAWFTVRRLAGVPIRRTSSNALEGLPYGVAIGAGAVITAAMTLSSAGPIG